MKSKNIVARLLAVVLPAVLLVGMTQVGIKPFFMDILNKFCTVTSFIAQDGSDRISVENIINSYMPVVGFVESNYVETNYVDDPFYQYEEDIEYIDLGESETSGQETAKPQIVNETVENPGAKPGAEFITEPQVVTENTGEPSKFAKSDFSDFNAILNKYYTVTSITELTEKKFNMMQGLEQDMTIKQDNSAPQILIFHTHSQEEFVDSIPGDVSTTIVGVGARLAEILSSQYGYNVIHDTSVYDYVGGVLDRSKAYTYAEQGIAKILAQYPSIEVVLDIHRDGVDESVRLVTDVNGKPTARVMFFNGISYTRVNGDIDYLDNPYIQGNLAMSLQMRLLGDSYYPGWLRKNYIHGYRYCLHFREKSMLIEVGAQNNTLEEELNAMEPLAATLDRLFKGEKGYQ